MKKNFVFKSLTAVAMGLAAAGCSSHDTDLYNPDQLSKEAQEQANAEYAESFSNNIAAVSSQQSWTTVTLRTAEVTVNLGLDQSYTVAIYTSNPLFSEQTSLLALTKVQEGRTAKLTFDAPTAQTSFFVGVFDSKGRGITEAATLEDGVLKATVGGSAANARMTRAAEDVSVYPSFVRTLDNYLNPTLDLIKEVQPYANFSIVGGLTIDDMKAYTAITDDIIVNETSSKNRTLSDMSWYYDPADYPAHGDGKHYRVAAGTEVTEPFNINATYGVLNEAVIYVEGKLHLNGNTLNGPTIVVGAGGEIVIDGNTNMSNSGRLIVMAGGKVTGEDGVEFNVNNGAACYNAGEISFNGQLNVNGSDTYNNGTINVDILRNTAGGRFINFGQITARTNKQASDSYNSTIINGCYMHFTDNAGIGTLTLLDNSRLDVDGRAEFNQATQTLYNLSEINANEIWVNSTTFAGPTATGTFAVVKTNKVWANQGADLNATDNLYFDWSVDNLVNHSGELQTLDNEWSIKGYIKAQNFKYVNEESAPFTIPAGDCTGNGYNDKDPGEIIIPGTGDDPLPVYYSVAFEDLGAIGDFDFNDVVLYVEHNTQTNKANVKLMAAGGELSVDVKYYDDVLFTKDDGRMTNTTSKGSVIATAQVDMANPATDLLHFGIVVKKDNGVSLFIESATQTGKAPQALIIPGAWAWPKERVSITTAYPQFAEWVKNVTNTSWYDSPVEGQVVR